MSERASRITTVVQQFYLRKGLATFKPRQSVSLTAEESWNLKDLIQRELE